MAPFFYGERRAYDARVRTSSVATPAVLGINAGRSLSEPSGVALWHLVNRTWRCLRVAPSYARFCEGADWEGDVAAGPIDVAAILATCRHLLDGSLPGVIAANVSLAVAFNRSRPAERLFVHALEAAGYRPPGRPSVKAPRIRIEVSPELALARISGRGSTRYKVLEARRYWPDLSARVRRQLLLQEWRTLLWRLGKQARGIEIPLPTNPQLYSFAALRRFEVAIGALACAWAGTEFLMYGRDTKTPRRGGIERLPP